MTAYFEAMSELNIDWEEDAMVNLDLLYPVWRGLVGVKTYQPPRTEY